MEKPERSPRKLYGTLKGHRRFFSFEDDQLLRQFKTDSLTRSWAEISQLMPGFSARQLRERWSNYLSPSLKTTSWTEAEDAELLRWHAELGPRWGVIGARMGNRSPPDIKNRFQSLRNRSERSFRTLRRETPEPMFAPPPPQMASVLQIDVRTLPPLIGRARAPRETTMPAPDCPTDFSIKSFLIEPGCH
jgi:hypothetical protein